MKKTPLTPRQRKLLKCLVEYHGIVSPACESAHISRKTHYQWCLSSPEYKQAVADIREQAIDWVESKLHKNIENGNVLSQIFFLKCLGKERGYVEKTETDISGHLQLDINKTVVKLEE